MPGVERMMVDHTSQLSRITQSPAAADMSGGKAPETLSTVWKNFAVEEAVWFQSDSFSETVTSPGAEAGTAGFPTSSVRHGD